MPPLPRPRFRHPLLAGLAFAAVATASAGGYTWIRVHQGDTVWAIAARYHTTVAEIVALNHLPGNGDLIYAGSRLKVPTHARESTGRVASPRRVVSTYTVRRGDSLDAIAARWHVPPQRIARANHLPPSLIVVIGQRLRIVHWVHHTRPARSATGPQPRAGVPGWVARRRAQLSQMPVPTPTRLAGLIDATARRMGVDPAFAKAIAWQESGFNQRAVSPVGAIGAMQVMPATGRFVSTYVAHRQLHLMHAVDNVTAGVGLLSALLADTGGNERLAAAGYYQGLRSVRAHGMFPDTRRYVADVMALRSRF